MSAELRVPPHSIDSEQAVLGGLMLDERAFTKVADWLHEEDFYRKDHRLIFRAITDLSNKRQSCDAVTMGEWFERNGLAELVGGTSYVVQLANTTPSAANIIAYAEIVREKAELRRLADIGTKLTTGALGTGASSVDLAATSMHELLALDTAKLRGGLEPVKPAMKLLVADTMARHQRGPGLLGLPTPWPRLNAITKGLRDGLLYVIGARPSIGKSVVGENLAGFTALRGDRVAMFSVEMTSTEVLARAIAAHGEIPFEWVEQPDDDEVYWQRYTAIAAKLVESQLLIDDTPALRIEQLTARARRAHQQRALRLIVIDHLHDMGVDTRHELRHEYGRIAQGAKTLAKELNCPVVLFAQLNRNVAGRTDKRPVMTDLRESGEIEQKADVILFLHREDYYDTDDRHTHMQDVVELIPRKGRNIKLGETIYLRKRFDQMRLDEWDGPLPAPPATQTGKRLSGFRAEGMS